MDYDVIVIGSGPSGEAAAMSCVKNGLRVAIVEEQKAVGGNCAHKGTIPSKSLRHIIKQIQRLMLSVDIVENLSVPFGKATTLIVSCAIDSTAWLN